MKGIETHALRSLGALSVISSAHELNRYADVFKPSTKVALSVLPLPVQEWFLLYFNLEMGPQGGKGGGW